MVFVTLYGWRLVCWLEWNGQRNVKFGVQCVSDFIHVVLCSCLIYNALNFVGRPTRKRMRTYRRRAILIRHHCLKSNKYVVIYFVWFGNSGSTSCQINTVGINGWIAYLIVWFCQNHKFLLRRAIFQCCCRFKREFIISIRLTMCRIKGVQSWESSCRDTPKSWMDGVRYSLGGTEVTFSSVITFIAQTSLGSIFDLSPGRCLVVLNIQFLSCIKYSIP